MTALLDCSPDGAVLAPAPAPPEHAPARSPQPAGPRPSRRIPSSPPRRRRRPAAAGRFPGGSTSGHGCAVLPAARPVPSARLRLTRRGRVVVTLLLLALVTTAAISHRPPRRSAAPPALPATVVVQPGDTLWSIATRVAPEADPRRTIGRITADNRLEAGRLLPGQALTVQRN